MKIVVLDGYTENPGDLSWDELGKLGHSFFSISDTEVIAKAYKQWGTDFVDHLIGMFSLVSV